jgi:hypothetical protein
VFNRFLEEIPFALEAWIYLWPTCIWLMAADRAGSFATTLITGLSILGNSIIYTYVALIGYLLYRGFVRTFHHEHPTQAI